MTDSSPGKFEWSKAGATGISVEVIQHIAPPLVKSVQLHTGWDDGFCSEIVYFALATVAGYSVYLTPSHFVQTVTDLILDVRRAIKKWRDAVNQPLDKPPS